jgi:hypothetical protein
MCADLLTIEEMLLIGWVENAPRKRLDWCDVEHASGENMYGSWKISAKGEDLL